MLESFLDVMPLTLILSGITFILAGWWLAKMPPGKRNILMGYRTIRSMKSQEAWDFSQKYGGKMLARSGYFLCTIGVLSAFFPFPHFWLEFILTMILLLLGAFAPIYLTEKELKKRFPE